MILNNSSVKPNLVHNKVRFIIQVIKTKMPCTEVHCDCDVPGNEETTYKGAYQYDMSLKVITVWIIKSI